MLELRYVVYIDCEDCYTGWSIFVKVLDFSPAIQVDT